MNDSGIPSVHTGGSQVSNPRDPVDRRPGVRWGWLARVGWALGLAWGLHGTGGPELVAAQSPAHEESPSGQSEAEALVEQLGAEEFSQRERATSRLIELGLVAKSAVEAGRTHPDREIRYRCERISQIVGELDFQRRLTAFLAGRSDGSDLPAWRQFVDVCGDNGDSRSLFVEMQKAEARLLEAVQNGPQGVARVAEARTAQLQNLQRRGGQVIDLGSIAAMLFAAIDAEVKLGLQTSFAVVNLCSQPTFVRAMAVPAQGKILRKLLSRWITNSEGPVAQQSMFLAMRFEMKEGLIPATRILQNAGEQPFVRQTALITAAKLGDASHEGLFEAALTDASRLSSQRINNVQYETQLRDVALAALLLLKKQDPKQFGFDRIQLNDSTLFNLGTVGFENEDQRKAAFDKYHEFQAR